MRKFNPNEHVRVEQDTDDGDWCVYIKRPNGLNTYVFFTPHRSAAAVMADNVRTAMREWSMYERQQIAEELADVREMLAHRTEQEIIATNHKG